MPRYVKITRCKTRRERDVNETIDRAQCRRNLIQHYLQKRLGHTICIIVVGLEPLVDEVSPPIDNEASEYTYYIKIPSTSKE